ncbi:dTMP kinase [Nitrolancea hollandica]|uniref:Thymidylate kinase n=1 Tax=Nitrolancea hollandica Lb TaxID=1129897 RepID=I4EF78_9BACT|nr:dTMP kinase [Nitrolancea hollandica]CCF83340.1 thymidylate kinase [Nitrolancea hollandica Lb]
MSLFIALEGPEGGGKSTQARRLHAALDAQGYDAILTREPGGTTIGEAIRAIVLADHARGMTAETEALLYMAARAQHVADVIAPALAGGKIVICDRYIDSTLAYQGAGRGLDITSLRWLQAFAGRGIRPDLVILLDVPVEVGLARKANSGEALNRLDTDEHRFHERVRTWFLEAAGAAPDRWFVIDATAPPAAVEQAVRNAVLRRLEHAEAASVVRGRP